MDIRLTASQNKEMHDLIDFLAFALFVHSIELVESARVSIGSFCANLEECGAISKNKSSALFDYMIEEAQKRDHL